ncbi:MAG: hypothetical protein GTO03_02770, partial [Planctomycetales bacterium]|nr:hypothetical protein [Planctomycetales bacterium]
GRIVAVSTPSVPEAAAWQAWLQSDRRHYHVPCPHCGTYQVLRFDRIKWPPDAGPDEILAGDLATYQCAECGETIAEQQRFWMIRRGVWIPETQKPAEKLPLDDREIVTAAGRMRNRWRPALAGQAPVTRQRGYRVWSVHSPWRSFSAIAARFLRSREDPEQM